MTFPNKKYTSPNDYVEAYFEQHLKAVSSVNGQKVAEAVSILEKLYESTGTLYVCGNGARQLYQTILPAITGNC